LEGIDKKPERTAYCISVEKSVFCAQKGIFLFAPKGAKSKDYLMTQFWDFSTVV
jgi:hypothetical protein